MWKTTRNFSGGARGVNLATKLVRRIPLECSCTGAYTFCTVFCLCNHTWDELPIV